MFQFLKSPQSKRVVALLVCFPLVFSLVAAAAEEGRYVRVTAHDVNIRAEGSTETAVIGHAEYGETYEVTGVQNGWYQVRFGQGSTGWISASLVKEGSRFGTKNPDLEAVEAIVDSVNVRNGASTSYEVITTLSPGTTYPLLQQSGDWVQVRLPGERTGWVARKYVRVERTSARQAAEEEQGKGTVIADSLHVRERADANAKSLGLAAQGDILKVLRAGGPWTEVEYKGQAGWVKSDYLTLGSSPAPPAAVPNPGVTPGPTLTLRGETNLRSGPGTNFALLRTGAAGSTFPITGKAGKWFEVELGDAKRAWVAGWLPQVNGSTEGVPQRRQTLDSGLRGKTVVIDPGHGGIDAGAVGRESGVFEKDITLQLSRLLMNKLLTTGANVVLTRPDDRYVPLAERVRIAEQQQADAFLSLHYNTHEDRSLSGSMTFYYHENGAGHELAKRIQGELRTTLGLPDLGARYGDYYVLRENERPAVLVETAFLTHPSDEVKSMDPESQERAAEGLFRAVYGYLSQN